MRDVWPDEHINAGTNDESYGRYELDKSDDEENDEFYTLVEVAEIKCGNCGGIVEVPRNLIGLWRCPYCGLDIAVHDEN